MSEPFPPRWHDQDNAFQVRNRKPTLLQWRKASLQSLGDAETPAAEWHASIGVTSISHNTSWLFAASAHHEVGLSNRQHLGENVENGARHRVILRAFQIPLNRQD